MSPNNNDEQTGRAVDDIVRHESDEVLAAEDRKRAERANPPQKPSLWQRIKTFCKEWWADPKKRWSTIAAVALFILLLGAIPPSRYFVLDTVGVRAGMSVQVLDKSTLQPLKNVGVSVQGAIKRTDDGGRVRFEKIRLGRTELKIDRYAFAPVTQTVTLGWGSNPLGQFQLTPTGAQYSFKITDYLSGKPIAKAEAESGEASAFSDKKGNLVLTVEEPAEELKITIESDGHRTEEFTIPANTKEKRTVHMAPARPHAFISNRSGTYDLYKIYADGKGEEAVLKGTGSERDDIALIPHPSENMVALVSARGNQRNADGFLLSVLTLVDLDTNRAEEIAVSERIQLVGWSEDRIVYVRVAAGASGNNPKRHRLISYDYRTKGVKELAASNSFNDVMLAAGKIYYAPSGAYQRGINVSLFKVNADGSDRQVILNKEVWNFFRTAYNHIAIAAPGNEWYDYRFGDKNPTKLSSEPGNLTSRVYVESPDNKTTLWTDKRDGKGVLLNYNIKTGKDKILQTKSGLKNPLSWLSNTAVVYRVDTDQETADYALSLDGGEPKKIRDVTNTEGLDRWYYH